MEKIVKEKPHLAKSMQKLGSESSGKKIKKLKIHNGEGLFQRAAKIKNIYSLANLNKNIPKVKNNALDPLHKEKRQLFRKSSMTGKRNTSTDGKNDKVTNEKYRGNSVANQEEWDFNLVPLSPDQVLSRFFKYLTTYEYNEILSYPNIYYIAAGLSKLESDPNKDNRGFDDDQNDYLLVKDDHIAYRYQVLKIIGQGSYGEVVKVYDHKDKKHMALKIIKNIKSIMYQAKLEAKILYKLLSDPSIPEEVIQVKDYFFFRNHLIGVFDLMECNLYQHVKSKNFNPLTLSEIKDIANQLLKAMKFYHKLGIIHCDLKPENIMFMNNKTRIVTIDFGTACFEGKKLFTYIQSRYYRAPEVILEIGYDKKIDIWSFGCVIAELAIGRPIFPGKDEFDQFMSIAEVLGMPPNCMFEKSSKHPIIRENFKVLTKNYFNCGKIKIPGSKHLRSLMPNYESLFYEFLESKM